jgi:hypothetical protein
MVNELRALISKSGSACRKQGWKKNWLHGGCYLHLEVSEFIESLRGKRGSPSAEAADVLMALFSVMDHYDVKIEDVLRNLHEVLEKLDVEKEPEVTDAPKHCGGRWGCGYTHSGKCKQ